MKLKLSISLFKKVQKVEYYSFKIAFHFDVVVERICNWIVVTSLIFPFDQILSAPIIELARIRSEYIFVSMVRALLIGDFTYTKFAVP